MRNDHRQGKGGNVSIKTTNPNRIKKMNHDIFYAHKAGSLKATLQGVPDWIYRNLFPITDKQDEEHFGPFIVALRAHIAERLAAAESEARAFAKIYPKKEEVAP